jgi:hypothetical protein
MSEGRKAQPEEPAHESSPSLRLCVISTNADRYTLPVASFFPTPEHLQKIRHVHDPDPAVAHQPQQVSITRHEMI